PVYNTNFSSSDLTIANFGAELGRVYAGQDGSATITAGNGGFTAASTVAVQTFSPTFLSFLPIPGFTNGVAVDGAYAYVAAGLTEGTSGLLEIADVSVPASPQLLGAVGLTGEAKGVDVVDQLAVVAAGSAGVAVVDVSDPSSPVIRGTVALQADVSGAGAVTV